MRPSNSCGLYSKRDCVPYDTTLNSPSKRTLKNLRLKTDKKRLIDDDGFQTPDKRHTAKKIGKKNPSLPPATSQTSDPAQAPPPPAESSDSEIEDEDTARQLAPTLISKLTGKFLRITVQSDDEYRKLAQFLRPEGVETRTAGGTAIYCKSNLVQSRAPLPGIQYMDATAIEIKINNFPPLRVVSAYARFCAEINRKFPEKDFLKILNSSNNLIIAGDFNASHKTWNNTRSNNFGFRLKRLIQNYPNASIVAPYTPTHINSHSRSGVRDSIIDLAVFKNIPFNYDIRAIDDLCSDHLPVILTLYTNSDTMKISAQLSTNWENFRFLLKNKPLPIPASPSNEHLDVAIGRLGENISEALVAASKPKFKTAPIKLPPDIRSTIRHRNRGALGSIAVAPIEKAEVIADSLQKQFEPNTDVENPRFFAHIQRKVQRFLDSPTCMDLEKTSPSEIQGFIKNLKPNKSPGIDLITNRFLKNLPTKFIIFIALLFNMLLENCYFPKSWRMSVMIPSLKPNSDDSNPQNYRPISLLSSLSKSYEFVILNRLNQHCLARNIIIPEQHGFVTKGSTVTQLLRVTELVHTSFQNHQATGMLFVDIANAFDKIWHDGLVSKMMRLEFSDQILKIIHSYLNSRELRVRVENCLSSPRPVKSGIPQGSLLGPRLFNLYINDIPKADNVHLAMYEDDTAIISQHTYNFKIIERSQNYITRFQLWLVA
ncbi:RNA-directed DNA polymerase from mobile element jockey [Trichonephila clavipes]|uniref:RNA-directed DNA polymerase from mobile element jockey n=1 Tax=Trichonephila clavipes TaxID=2585209 RepID=A0A8X6SQG1_TRICX|nr:RNA-directed DNA polymerase from mobile element jockey [Trichonephila clavipes]